MPDSTKRIDDRTFFILYALTKKRHLNIPALSMLYGDLPFNRLQEEFALLKKFNIKIHLPFAPSSENTLETLEQLRRYESEIQNFLSSQKKKKEPSPIVQKLLPYALAAEFTCRNSAKLTRHIEDYLQASPKSRKLYFYNDEKHQQLFKKVQEWAMAGMCAPYKIGYQRFEEYMPETDNSKYAVFHFLYQLEKSKTIEISDLAFEENKPLIIFNRWKKKIHHQTPSNNTPNGQELATFETLHLFENGILNSAPQTKFHKCDNIETKIFEMFLNKPYLRHSYADIAQRIHVEEKEVPRRISKARCKFKKIIPNSRVKYFINNQKEKTFQFKTNN